MKGVVIFASGMTIGAVVGVLTTRKYFRRKADETILKCEKELQEYYGRTDEYVREDSEEGDVERPVANREEQYKKDEVTEPKPIDYAKIYGNAEAADAEEDEITPEEEADMDHEQNRNRPPMVIPLEAIGDIPSYYDERTLLFYRYNQTLTDEDDNPIEDEPERFVGSCLAESGFCDNDEEILIVRNFALDTIYWVRKVLGSYTE